MSGPSSAVRRVLLLTHRVPWPPDRGDRIRSYNLLRVLSRHFAVSLACVSDEPVTAAQQRELEKLTRQLAIAQVPAAQRRWRGVKALLAGQAATPAAFYEPVLADTVAEWHRADPFDAVIVFCTGMWRYLGALTPPPRVRILDMVDVDSLKWAAYADATRSPMRWVYRTEAQRLREIEIRAAHNVNAITLISDAEVRAYHQHVLGRRTTRAKILAAGNGVDLRYFHPLSDPDQSVIGFVGVLDYPPNERGICWFAREVLPKLRQHVPEAKLLIVGRNPTRQVLRLAGTPSVEVVGPVDDVRHAIARCSVMIAPLPIARGVQNKVLEAMACSRAVVASPQAFEGIRAEPNRHLLVADTPDQWTTALTKLLTDLKARHTLATAAREQIEQHYHWSATLQPLLDVLTDESNTGEKRQATKSYAKAARV